MKEMRGEYNMLNQCILVGQVNQIKDEKDNKVITLEIRKNNSKDEEYDYLPIRIGSNLANASEYLKVGSTLGIKARLVCDDAEKITVIAEKLTFINTRTDE